MATRVDVVNANNEKVDSLELPEAIFGAAVESHLLHEVVRMQRANRRPGTGDTKGRAGAVGRGEETRQAKGDRHAVGGAPPGALRGAHRQGPGGSGPAAGIAQPGEAEHQGHAGTAHNTGGAREIAPRPAGAG